MTALQPVGFETAGAYDVTHAQAARDYLGSRSLWRAVLIQAVRDLNLPGGKPTDRRDRRGLHKREARAFFENRRRVTEVCENAGVDPAMVLRMYASGELESLSQKARGNLSYA